MTNTVVPFARDAAYLHQRANINRREGRALDALELFRRAAERAPENTQYAMDLAQMYCEMGCYHASARILMALCTQDQPEGYFGLCVNLFGMERYDEAYQAMMRFIMHDQNAIKRAEVHSLLKRILLLRVMRMLKGRKSLRANRLFEQAASHMRAGRFARGATLCRRCLGARPNYAKARALYALALAAQGQKSFARVQLVRALHAGGENAQMRLIAAYAYERLGDREAARRLARGLMRHTFEGRALEYQLSLMGRLGMYASLQPLLDRSLKAQPYNRLLLYMRAVNALRSGADYAQAKGYFSRMRRIDPDDEVAKYYLDAAQGALRARGAGFACRLPRAELDARRAKLRGYLAADAAEALAQWRASGEPREICVGALRGEDGVTRGLARQLLLRIGTQDALMLIRANLPEDAFADPEGLETHLCMQRGQMTAGIIGARIPPSYLKAVRMAIGYLDVGNGEAAAELFRHAIEYVAHARRHPLHGKRAWAAALVYSYGMETPKPWLIDLLAVRFACSPRGIERYIRKMRPTDKGETNHARD